jgi:hypothetical protein
MSALLGPPLLMKPLVRTYRRLNEMVWSIISAQREHISHGPPRDRCVVEARGVCGGNYPHKGRLFAWLAQQPRGPVLLDEAGTHLVLLADRLNRG